jgi:hypothetical protein
MQFTLDTTELTGLVPIEQWFIFLLAVGWIVREIFLMSHLKRLRLMDQMNKRLMMKMHPRGSLLTQKEVNKLFLFTESFGTLGGAGISNLIAQTTSEQASIAEAKGILKQLMEAKHPDPETISGATIVIPDDQVGNFLAHIEVDGFSGQVLPGPMPNFSSVKVPVSEPGQMQPLTKSIATWEAMRKDASN